MTEAPCAEATEVVPSALGRGNRLRLGPQALANTFATPSFSPAENTFVPSPAFSAVAAVLVSATRTAENGQQVRPS